MRTSFNDIKQKTIAVYRWVTNGKRLFYCALIASIAYAGYFYRNSIYEIIKVRYQIRKVDKEIERLKKEQEYYEQQLNEIFSSNEALEHFAREHYLMKAPNEDVYIVSEDD